MWIRYIMNNQLVIFDMENISLGCIVKRKKISCWALVFSTPNNASSWDIFHIKNNHLIILYLSHRWPLFWQWLAGYVEKQPLVWNEYCVKNCLTFSQMTNFGPFQTERGCRQQFQISWKWKKVLRTGRKHCGKRRNCSLRAISPFPTEFSKYLHCRHVKTRACLGKG